MNENEEPQPRAASPAYLASSYPPTDSLYFILIDLELTSASLNKFRIKLTLE